MMITVPIYDMIILPEVTYYFKGEVFKEMDIPAVKAGDTLLFLMQKEEKSRKEMTAEDFFPLGVAAEIEAIDKEGNVSVRTVERVEISDLNVTKEKITAAVAARKETLRSEERRVGKECRG